MEDEEDDEEDPKFNDFIAGYFSPVSKNTGASRMSEDYTFNNDTDYNTDIGEDIDDNEIFLSLFYAQDKLGCCYYDTNRKCLFILPDIPESSKFELATLLIDDLNPYSVMTCTKCDMRFINYLKIISKYQFNSEDHQELSENDKTESTSGVENTPNFDEDHQKRLKSVLEPRPIPIEFELMASCDFDYEIAKDSIINLINLENMPRGLNPSDKLIFLSGLIDFDSKLMVRTIGAILKYMERKQINRELGTSIYRPQIYSIRMISFDKILYMNPNTYKSLQIFNNVDFVCTYKQLASNIDSFRTTLNDRYHNTNNTLYSLFLNKIHTKVGISKLRSYFMRPTRDAAILNERHRIIEFFLNYKNKDFNKLLQNSLKKCKYINPILKRMRITNINLKEWKRLINTTEAYLQIAKLVKLIAERLIEASDSYSQESDSFNTKTSENRSFLIAQPGASLFSNLSPIRSNFIQSKESRNKNILSNLIDSDYVERLEHLLNIFHHTVDMAESKRLNKCSVNSNISDILDEKRNF